jgi:hypothetical protein
MKYHHVLTQQLTCDKGIDSTYLAPGQLDFSDHLDITILEISLSVLSGRE